MLFGILLILTLLCLPAGLSIRRSYAEVISSSRGIFHAASTGKRYELYNLNCPSHPGSVNAIWPVLPCWPVHSNMYVSSAVESSLCYNGIHMDHAFAIVCSGEEHISSPFLFHWDCGAEGAQICDIFMLKQREFPKIYHYSFSFQSYIQAIEGLLLHLNAFYYIQNVHLLCLHVNWTLHQNLYRKHDFKAHTDSLKAPVFLKMGSYLLFVIFLRYFDLFRSLRRLLTHYSPKKCVGGGHMNTFSCDELKPHALNESPLYSTKYKFLSYKEKKSALAFDSSDNNAFEIDLPIHILIAKLPIRDLKQIAAAHGIYTHSKYHIGPLRSAILNHVCMNCPTFVSVFEPIDVEKTALHKKQSNLEAVKRYQNKFTERCRQSKLISSKKYFAKNKKKVQADNMRAARKYREKHKFPPTPPSRELRQTIIREFCDDVSPNSFSESGCSVCGKLTPVSELDSLSNLKLDLSVLKCHNVTQKERLSADDPIESIGGPVLLENTDNVCKTCHTCIKHGNKPPLSLANGLWLGEVPAELSDLTFTEQLLIARVRHNRCIVRVSSGMYKMKANAIMFANPTPKIYDILPPSLDELDDVLAFIYTGPCKPTKSDFERTPLLVRRNKVAKALDWLKLNHSDYYDLEISQNNLNEYPDNDIPVVVDYRQSFSNKSPESTAVHDNEKEEGAEAGSCPFVVHGITGEEYSTKSLKAIKAIALKHLKSDGKILAIGHAENPESIYKNPQLFPQMLPWLFPYGLGGIGNSLIQGRMSDIAHKRHLLMYHDKRFQKDPHFPLIAFNHEQIKECTTGGYLLAEMSKFEHISERLMNIDTAVLNSLARKMEDGEHVSPETDQEKDCFQLIKDLDHVGGHVKGSLTNKKYMRNEIWSLISFIGAPSWFITFSPADNMHPISLYYADTQETFTPKIRSSDERYRLIAENPVAGARFFHFMCELFIKHVLGVNADHRGFYGETNAYYGVVEQQGRLTLHLHMLLWLKGCLTPQQIRDKIMDPNSDFQKELVEYLESVHVGEFFSGSMDDVRSNVDLKSEKPLYKNPTQTLPVPPPKPCSKSASHDGSAHCTECNGMEDWWQNFSDTVDDLALRSNVHNCGKYNYTNEKAQKKDRPSCMNKLGKCKARFPRPLYETTQVDPLTGALNVRKGEPWLNTFTPLVTYLLRCNSDVTSLLSGTAIKAVVAYVSDYITKPGLKTYSIFDVIRTVFDRNSEMIGSSMKRKEKARRLVTQIINSLTAKLEIGGPMASLYLLGNPDHYTSHTFVPVYWRNYVREVMKSWADDDRMQVDEHPEKVVIQKHNGRFIGVSTVHDYVHRPKIYDDITLYEWVRGAKRLRKRSSSCNGSENKDCRDSYQSNQYAEFENHRSTTAFLDTMNIDDQFDKMNIQDNDGDVLSVEDTDDSHDREDSDIDNACGDSTVNFNHKPLDFLEDHPLHDSHCVSFNPGEGDLVPNFVGGSLPRSDRGDREYYCTAMLTLFKPWRNGRDLKADNDTWDETFVAHEFNPREIQIMNNFNIRYECLDARDDYSAQIQQETISTLPQFVTSEIIHEIDLDSVHDGADFGSNDDTADYDPEYDLTKYRGLGNYGSVIKAQMDATETVVRTSGWLDSCPDGNLSIDRKPVEPESHLPASKWKTVVRDERQLLLAERNQKLVSKGKHKRSRYKSDPNADHVMIVDQSYLHSNFKARDINRHATAETIETKFNLNVEQKRAFRIVANHSSSPDHGQLKMYLGGMAGTGKSQVIKALMNFFEVMQESYRFVILGPTGTSAAQQNGSTYHFFLGINPNSSGRNEATSIAQLQVRLEGVDYIFIDELSMLSCHDMYQISAKLAKATNVHDEPFGGINIIFAGDFAQLPPVGGSPLYSGTVGTQVDSSLTLRAQENSIGKALWHQITTVVILRENMRQRFQSVEDTLLRTALVNMRYGKCTSDDICFLRTRIAGRKSGQPNLASKDFRNVPIICGIHSQKDMINSLGCERFATDTNQKLTNFYSDDRWGKEKLSLAKGGKKSKQKTVHSSDEINLDIQKEIWRVHHGATENFPGKLALCLDMPVMIRNNEATELCMTKGQEGFVAGWQTSHGFHKQRILDTLFVRLHNPPKSVKIPGLPENVVPITKSKHTIQCLFPSDAKESIERQQVWVLPNFAMTAHAAQGKTRPHNVVHLNSCPSHMSYYSSLSRSATASGTVIIQGFDAKVITKGCSGYLRQEFRELEVLDDITRLKFESKLPDNFDENWRYTLIQKYQTWKGKFYVPEKTDATLKWSPTDPLHIINQQEQTPWQFSSKKKDQPKTIPTQTSFVPAKSSVSVFIKRKKSSDNTFLSSKKARLADPSHGSMPLGLIWDSNNYSCAYDSLLVILYDIWKDNPDAWSIIFEALNEYTSQLSHGFTDITNAAVSFEHVRDHLRNLLHRKNPTEFPMGCALISVASLACELFTMNEMDSFFQHACLNCEFFEDSIDYHCLGYVLCADRTIAGSTEMWIKTMSQKGRKTCPQCMTAMRRLIFYKTVPPLLILEYSTRNISTSHKISIKTDNGDVHLFLRGIVYHGQNHFTSRVITSNKEIWYHDGIMTQKNCEHDGSLKNIYDSDIKLCRGNNLVFAIYAQSL